MGSGAAGVGKGRSGGQVAKGYGGGWDGCFVVDPERAARPTDEACSRCRSPYLNVADIYGIQLHIVRRRGNGYRYGRSRDRKGVDGNLCARSRDRAYARVEGKGGVADPKDKGGIGLPPGEAGAAGPAGFADGKAAGGIDRGVSGAEIGVGKFGDRKLPEGGIGKRCQDQGTKNNKTTHGRMPSRNAFSRNLRSAQGYRLAVSKKYLRMQIGSVLSRKTK